MDPWIFLRPLFMAWAWWVRRVGVKTLLLGMGASTIAVVIYGCVEGGSW